MKTLHTPSDVSESQVDSVVEDALELSSAPENWPEASDVDVCSLTADELRAVIMDEMVIANEGGTDPHKAAAQAVAAQINKARLWERTA